MSCDAVILSGMAMSVGAGLYGIGFVRPLFCQLGVGVSVAAICVGLAYRRSLPFFGGQLTTPRGLASLP